LRLDATGLGLARRRETVKLIREAEVPAPVWAELKAMELIPREFPVS